MPSMIDLIEPTNKKTTQPNAPGSNVPPFDIELKPGVDAEVEARKIVGQKSMLDVIGEQPTPSVTMSTIPVSTGSRISQLENFHKFGAVPWTASLIPGQGTSMDMPERLASKGPDWEPDPVGTTYEMGPQIRPVKTKQGYKFVEEPTISQGEEKPNFIKRGLDALSFVFGPNNLSSMSEGAKAQALVMHMAKEEGIPVSQYRESPEILEKVASGFISGVTGTLAPRIKGALTGETDYPTETTAGYVGEVLGSLAGFYMGPMTVAGKLLSPVLNVLPMAYQGEAVGARILKSALRDSVLLGTATGISNVGEALDQVTFSQAADKVWEGIKGGATVGTIFGISKGLFPTEGLQTGVRIFTGLVGLNAYRTIEAGGNPFTNRPLGKVLFDIGLDTVFLYKGLPQGMRFELAKDLTDLNDKITQVREKEVEINSIPDEVLKQAQMKVLEVEKNQIELETKAAAEKAKVSIETKAELEQNNAEIKNVLEGKVEEVKPTETVSELNELKTEQPKSMNELIKEEKPKYMVDLVEEKPITEEVKPIEVKVKEPITEVDLQTGTKTPESLLTNHSPFRNSDRELTNKRREMLNVKGAVGSPETFTQYLINEVNRYLNGEEVPIDKVRHGLSELATRADEVRMQFDNGQYFQDWKDTVREAAKWARGADRLIDKRTGGTQLNMMIPIDMIPEAVHNLILTGKKGMEKLVGYIKRDKLKMADLYRNKEIFDNTGFWLGKDGKWRYEIDDSKITTKDKLFEGTSLFMDEAIDAPGLFKSVPEIKSTRIKVNTELDSMGKYDPVTNFIEIGVSSKDTIIHELQHAVNNIVGSRFRGSSPNNEQFKMIENILVQINSKVKNNPKMQEEIFQILNDIGIRQKEISLYELNKRLSKYVTTPEEHEIIDSSIDQLISEDSFDRYLKDPGEMEARLASYRMVMSAEQRKRIPPWETLDDMLVGEMIDQPYRPAASFNLYMGIDPTKIPEAIKGIFNSFKDYMKEFDSSTETKKFELAFALKQLEIDIVRAGIEQSETLLKDVRKLYPAESQRVIDRQRSAVNGKGYGEIIYKQMNDEIYKGKSDAQVRLINAYILARRFKDIYGYRSEKDYKHQPGYGSNQTISAVSIIEMVRDLPSNTWAQLIKIPEVKKLFGEVTQAEVVDAIRSGESFFEWNRKIIDDLVEAGIKSEVEGELLKAHDFRKFKTITIEKLYDFDYNVQLRGESIRSTASGVESLGHGSVKILDPDARLSAHEMAVRAYGSIANQAAKVEWKNLAEQYPDNRIVSTTQKAGWSPMPYFEKGVKKEIYFNPDAAKYLISKSHDISHRASTVIRTLTMAPVTRSLAVGTSPVWSTFIGLPMDVIHSLWTAKTFEKDANGIRFKPQFPFYETTKGEYKSVYSPWFPQSTMQIGIDMSRTLTDTYKRGPLFENLAKHGLSMPLLSMRENRYVKGTKPPGDWAKLLDLLSYHGVTMETWVRAATADRVIRNRAKEKGMSYEEALKNDDIMYEAVHSARDRMDYNQGGWMIKALDQNGFIFLNAASVGTRTFWRSAVENPVDFAVRTAQLMTLAAGVTAMAWTQYEHIMKEIPTEGNEKNFIYPLFPDLINWKDRDGNTRHLYVRLRMDPGPAFMYKLSDNLTRTYLYDRGLIKKEPDYSKVVDSLKQLGPYGISLPPSIQMRQDYVTNTSWWKDRQMYTELGGRTLTWPNSRHEGEFDPNVSRLAKDVGSVTGLSPKRLQGSVSNVIPTNNEFIYMFGKAYQEAFSDVPKEDMGVPWWVALVDNPITGRVIGITVPGYDRGQMRDKVQKEEDLENVAINGKFNMLAKDYAWKNARKREEVIGFIKEQKDIDVVDKLLDKLEFIEDIKGLEHRGVWLGMWHMTPEAKAKEYARTLNSYTDKEKVQLEKELNFVDAVGGYTTNKFLDVYVDEMIRLKKKKGKK